MKHFTNFFSVVSFLIVFSIMVKAADNSTTNDSKRNCIESLLNGIKSNNNGLKSSCAYMLGELQIKEAVIPLMRILHNDECEEVRISALLALYKLNTPLSSQAVKQAIRFDKSKRINKLAQNFYTDIQIKRQRNSENNINKTFAHHP